MFLNNINYKKCKMSYEFKSYEHSTKIKIKMQKENQISTLNRHLTA